MAARTMMIGTTGQRVALNVAQIRKARGLSLRRLSRIIEEAGWPLSADSVNKIELGMRRVDVDDLVALAAALEVEPAILLAPITISTEVAIATDNTMETL